MVVGFDLDDTLYPEETYVRSGFRAVAEALSQRFGIAADDAFGSMWDSLQTKGRGSQFNDVISSFGLTRRQSVAELVRIYRHHVPEISLPAETRTVLDQMKPRHLYVVTDGHKVVQQAKLTALGIGPEFRHAYITHRYGIANRKPSTHVFELMIKRERCRARDIVYIGDDPSKDFRGVRPLGIRTIRVLTGRHASVSVPAAADAEVSVPRLAAVPELIFGWEAQLSG